MADIRIGLGGDDHERKTSYVRSALLYRILTTQTLGGTYSILSVDQTRRTARD